MFTILVILESNTIAGYIQTLYLHLIGLARGLASHGKDSEVNFGLGSIVPNDIGLEDLANRKFRIACSDADIVVIQPSRVLDYYARVSGLLIFYA